MFPYSFLAFLFKCRALACYVKVFPGFVPPAFVVVPAPGDTVSFPTRGRDYGQTRRGATLAILLTPEVE
jgi:hypothetical protein